MNYLIRFFCTRNGLWFAAPAIALRTIPSHVNLSCRNKKRLADIIISQRKQAEIRERMAMKKLDWNM